MNPGRCIGLIAAAIFCASCGDNQSAAQCEAGPREGYPAGPYGTTIGSVISDLTFVDPEGTSMFLHAIHQTASDRLLLVATAAEWCTACIEEQPAIENLYATYKARGLRVLVAVFEDGQFSPATAGVASSWKDRYDLSFDVVADPEFQLGAYYDASLTPMNMVVDVCSMEIIRVTTGWDEDLMEATVEGRL